MNTEYPESFSTRTTLLITELAITSILDEITPNIKSVELVFEDLMEGMSGAPDELSPIIVKEIVIANAQEIRRRAGRLMLNIGDLFEKIESINELPTNVLILAKKYTTIMHEQLVRVMSEYLSTDPIHQLAVVIVMAAWKSVGFPTTVIKDMMASILRGTGATKVSELDLPEGITGSSTMRDLIKSAGMTVTAKELRECDSCPEAIRERLADVPDDELVSVVSLKAKK